MSDIETAGKIIARCLFAGEEPRWGLFDSGAPILNLRDKIAKALMQARAEGAAAEREKKDVKAELFRKLLAKMITFCEDVGDGYLEHSEPNEKLLFAEAKQYAGLGNYDELELHEAEVVTQARKEERARLQPIIDAARELIPLLDYLPDGDIKLNNIYHGEQQVRIGFELVTEKYIPGGLKIITAWQPVAWAISQVGNKIATLAALLKEP